MKNYKVNLNNIGFIFILLLINILAHYLPFERVSLSIDDYSRLSKPYLGLNNFIYGPSDRPLHFFIVDIQNLFIKDSSSLGFAINLIFNSSLIITIWLFLTNFFKDNLNIFCIILIYVLLVNKVEIYHVPISSINILAGILYLLSIHFFINGSNKNNILFFTLSATFYTFGIFLYEIGFFIILYYFWYLLFNKKKNIIYFNFIIIFIAVFYLIYRTSNSFGLSEIEVSHDFNYKNIIDGFVDYFNNYLGRYTIRIIIYGVYQFFRIDIIWLILLLVLNLSLIFFIYNLKMEDRLKIKQIRTKYFFVILFIIFSIAPIINGASGSRHTIVPNIAIAVFLFYCLVKYFKKIKHFFFIMVFILLIINQGNAWSQVISCRINNSIYDYIKKIEFNHIDDYEYIIFNQGSFSRNISHSLINNDKTLETFFGTQSLNEQTVISMLSYNKKIDKEQLAKKFYSVLDLEFDNKNTINIKNINLEKYRSFSYEDITLYSSKILIIDYENIFNKGFINGNRSK